MSEIKSYFFKFLVVSKIEVSENMQLGKSDVFLGYFQDGVKQKKEEYLSLTWDLFLKSFIISFKVETSKGSVHAA